MKISDKIANEMLILKY